MRFIFFSSGHLILFAYDKNNGACIKWGRANAIRKFPCITHITQYFFIAFFGEKIYWKNCKFGVRLIFGYSEILPFSGQKSGCVLYSRNYGINPISTTFRSKVTARTSLSQENVQNLIFSTFLTSFDKFFRSNLKKSIKRHI